LFWWVIVTTVTTDLALMGAYSLLGGLLIAGGGITYTFLLFVALSASTMIGSVQWFVLRRYISRSGLWILASVIGGVIGPTITWFVIRVFDLIDEGFISLALLALISQTVIGFLQGFILSVQGSRFNWLWWLLASAIGIVGSFLTGTGLLFVLSNPVLTVFVFIMIGAPFGVVTGLSLMRLLR
jgi:hypothetical protein